MDEDKILYEIKFLAEQLKDSDYSLFDCTSMNESWRKVTITFDRKARTDR